MSNLRPKRTPPATGRDCPRISSPSPRWALVLCIATLFYSGSVHADANPFEAWAQMITDRPAQYRGPTIAFPDTGARPASDGWVLRSERVPLSLHAPSTLPQRRAELALRALENAYDWLRTRGWPLPYADGGEVGTADLDAYVVSGLSENASVAVGVPITWGALDAATSYVLLDSALPDTALERCALFALTQAALLGHNPAEPDSVRRASAAFVTWLATGDFGCDDATADAQHAPELGPIGERAEQTAALALWLAMISRRHDGGSGRFVRELWQLAEKHSEHPDALHVSPSVLQALGAALEKAGEPLDQAAAEFAIARYLASLPDREGPLPKLAADAAVPVTLAPSLAQLPKRLAVHEPALATYGSAYTRVPTSGARAGTRLQIWLRGEPDVRWSLVGIRLDAHGHELGRVDAPGRRAPGSFLPVELTQDTTEVLIVVTELPWQRPDARAPGPDEHYFMLILDAARL